MTSNVIKLPDSIIDPPLLIAIDIQREYTPVGRPYYINGVEPSVENCRRILSHARDQRWPVAHVRHVQGGHVFNEAMEYSRFVEGFEPRPHGFVFTKNNFSCYSNTAFGELLESAQRSAIYVIGYNSLMCCLSTIIEGHSRGHKLTFVEDASMEFSTPNADEAAAHLHGVDLIALYASVVDTEEALRDDSARRMPIPHAYVRSPCQPEASA